MNRTNATRALLGSIAVGGAISAAVLAAPSASAEGYHPVGPPTPKICENHVEYLDRPFGIKPLPGPPLEIYVTACAVGPGNGGPDEVAVPTP